MKNIKGIFKKDIDKVFKFPRSLFSTLILPGLIIFIIYFIIGQVAASSIKKIQEHESRVCLIDVPDSFLEAAETAQEIQDFGKVIFSEEALDKLEELKEEVRKGNLEAVVVFDKGFDEKISENLKPNVMIYYDNTSNNSNAAFGKIQTILEIQKDNFLREKEIDPYLFSYAGDPVFASEKTGGMILAMILPVLILSFILSSALGIGTDAVAGEKERGTLAKLLLLPIPRNHIIIGKILSTTFLTILSALSSFIGIMASLPFLKTIFAGNEGEIIDVISYGASDVLLLLLVLLLLAALASSLLLLASTIAKTIKEASALAMPIFIGVMILPMVTMFSEKTDANPALYLIPFYNFILIIRDLLSFNLSTLNYLLTVGSAAATISVLVFILIRLFKSERILYTQ
jgi:sodium transport system permease protein